MPSIADWLTFFIGKEVFMQGASYSITQIAEEQVPLAAGASPAFLISPFWIIVAVVIILVAITIILGCIHNRHQLEMLVEEENALKDMDEQWRDDDGRTT